MLRSMEIWVSSCESFRWWVRNKKEELSLNYLVRPSLLILMFLQKKMVDWCHGRCNVSSIKGGLEMFGDENICSFNFSDTMSF